MGNLSSYFVNDDNSLKTNLKYVIMGKNYRFSVLTPRLIRLEYNKDGKFEDRATSLVVNRNFENAVFNLNNTENVLNIVTEYFTLTYSKEKPLTSGNIKVVINGTDRVWTPNQKDIRNVGSLKFSLDDFVEKIKLDNGLYSLDGVVAIDDSKNYVIDNDTFIPREETTDIYLFAYRSDLGLCLQDYFNLTGYPPMIPRYSLGCWWYKNDRYDMYQIDDIIKKFNDNHLPLSVFLLGNNWHNDSNNFDYDNTLFDKKVLKSYFDSKKQKFGLTINPELPIYSTNEISGVLKQYLPADNNGNVSFIPLNSSSISLYLNNVVNNIISTGIDVFNIDYNNVNDKNGLFLLNHFHYVYANINERGVILSRNPGIASHRYPIIYSGKTRVSWNTLSQLPMYNNSAANLGISWHAHAIGGYHGGIEDAELYIRYIQFGVFNPVFILAGDTSKYYKREPWKWNQTYLSVIRDYMQLRNKLIPYIYNEGYIYHKYGVPFIQPLYYKYPSIYDEPNYVNQYFFGSKIMISPIVKRKNKEMNRVVQKIFIPKGIWYDYSTGKKFNGDKYYTCFYRDEDYPIFVKEGTIIPFSLDNNSNVPSSMELQVFPAENGLYSHYELYEDDGVSKQVNNNYMITKMNLDKVEDGYKFTIIRKEGLFDLPKRKYTLRFRNMNKPQKVIAKFNNQVFDNYEFEIEKNDLLINIEECNTCMPVEINIIGNNIEIEVENVVNEEIDGILFDLEINTTLKDQIADIIFSDLSVKKKRIGLRKLKKMKLEPKYINMFIGLLEFIADK